MILLFSLGIIRGQVTLIVVIIISHLPSWLLVPPVPLKFPPPNLKVKEVGHVSVDNLQVVVQVIKMVVNKMGENRLGNRMHQVFLAFVSGNHG
jgi:hypothetical protein